MSLAGGAGGVSSFFFFFWAAAVPARVRIRIRKSDARARSLANARVCAPAACLLFILDALLRNLGARQALPRREEKSCFDTNENSAVRRIRQKRVPNGCSVVY